MGNGTYQFRVKATKTDNVDSAYVTSGYVAGVLTAVAPVTSRCRPVMRTANSR